MALCAGPALHFYAEDAPAALHPLLYLVSSALECRPVPYPREHILMQFSVCRDGTAHASTSGAAAPGERAPPLSLDRFCATHTSEDNASFAEVLAASNKRRRLAQPWLFEDKSQVRCFACQRAAVCFARQAVDKSRRLAQPWLFEDKSQVRCFACQHAALGAVRQAAAGVMSGSWLNLQRSLSVSAGVVWKSAGGCTGVGMLASKVCYAHYFLVQLCCYMPASCFCQFVRGVPGSTVEPMSAAARECEAWHVNAGQAVVHAAGAAAGAGARARERRLRDHGAAAARAHPGALRCQEPAVLRQ